MLLTSAQAQAGNIFIETGNNDQKIRHMHANDMIYILFRSVVKLNDTIRSFNFVCVNILETPFFPKKIKKLRKYPNIRIMAVRYKERHLTHLDFEQTVFLFFILE